MFRLVSVWVFLSFVIVAILGDRSRLPAAPEVSIPDGYKEVQLIFYQPLYPNKLKKL